MHNLRDVDLDIPHRQLTVFCGVSGSGKTSLALDTLYAEGQRRYIESFSTYTRQFLDPLEKPDADRIDGLPPAVAVTRADTTRSSRATVGTATEVTDYLRLLFSKIGRQHCAGCGRAVSPDSPSSVVRTLSALPAGLRAMVCFPVRIEATGESAAGEASPASTARRLREDGFVRVVVGDRLWQFDDIIKSPESLPPAVAPPTTVSPPAISPQVAPPLTAARTHFAEALSQSGSFAASEKTGAEWLVVVDRVTTGAGDQRLRDSLETAFNNGAGACVVLHAPPPAASVATTTDASATAGAATTAGVARSVDGASYVEQRFHSRRVCPDCAREYAPLSPQLFSFNSPLGACAKCEGFGNLIAIDWDLVIPDKTKSLVEEAIAPWTTPAYTDNLQEMLKWGREFGIPVEKPLSMFTPEQMKFVTDGVPERSYFGIRGFFDWLEHRKYKVHHRVFLSRWRSSRTCEACGGQRLCPDSLAVTLGGRNMSAWTALPIGELRREIGRLQLDDWQRAVCRTLTDQISARLEFLDSVGLGYLTLDRTLRTLSGGEAQRVALTAALGASLVNMLYVLDEPSVGLHPADVDRLLSAIQRLRDRGNTVVMVEHEESMLRAADRLVEIGPGAGERGGEVVFQGTFDEMCESDVSLTGDYLTGRRPIVVPDRRRTPGHGWLRLTGARGNNLQNLTVELPLGVLCVVTGVSGSGKSSLIHDTLYGAICHRKRKECDPEPLPYEDIFGDGAIDDVVLVDQSQIGRSPRSNPVTYIKAFDPIRAVFAETVEARTHNYTAGHFSFNVEGGRCEACQGDGYLEIDMQFLPDVFMKCSQCGGSRYRKEILDIHYRGRSIADVLAMSVREAFAFFRGQPKVQTKLKQLIDVGLDYLRLGQPANTLSAGESQRLKLAAFLSAASRHRTLFLLDEPTTGLHFADIVQLLDCFETLLNVGHSLIVVEHNLQVMKAADYLIDLGPGPAEAGGRIVVQGTPEKVARCRESATGRILAKELNVDELNVEPGQGD